MKKKVALELWTARQAKDKTSPLVLRFSINRVAYRYPTGFRLTESGWGYEKKHGYPVTKSVIEMEDKLEQILESVDPTTFSMTWLRQVMEKPLVKQDSVSTWWERYEEYRDWQPLASRTRGLGDCTIKKLKEFFQKNPGYDDIRMWDAAALNLFHSFMINDKEAKVSLTTADIYMRQFSTFFTWIVDEKEILARHPFKKYDIPKSDNSWFPYSEEELNTIFQVEPKTPHQERARKWTILLLFSGGTDPKDFAEMTWRQMQSEAIQIRRSKVKKNAGGTSGKKLLYKSEMINEIFSEFKHQKAKPDDFVFDIFRKDKSEDQNLELLKALMNNINANMNEMLENTGVNFTIKRLRPTAAMIANNATKDMNYVKDILMHSSLRQTSIYMKNTPSAVTMKNQSKFEKAMKKIMVKKKPTLKPSASLHSGG